jgi:hypothetical protein
MSARKDGEAAAMSTLTKLALGMMGRLRPKPARGDASETIVLPEPQKEGGIPLMEGISKRRSDREFASQELPLPLLSNLLWAAYGVNRADGHRTAPSALDAQEIDVYVALPSGAYLYDATAHQLKLIVSSDLRSITGYQDFVDDAPLDLVFVALQPYETRACRPSRKLRFSRSRRDFPECLFVRRGQWARNSDPSLDRPGVHRQRLGVESRPPSAAIPNGRLPEGIST